MFDEVNIHDAFTCEKVTVGTGAAKNIGTQIMKAAGAAEWSVQPAVEGLVGAMRNSNTRRIEFNWGEFVFVGTLEQINVDYTMFSPLGKPLRAKMQLRILNDFNDQASTWQDEALDFLGMKPGSVVGVKDLSSATGKVGSILNLGF
jgi:hypothetical protein